jgi:hypothetical protein
MKMMTITESTTRSRPKYFWTAAIFSLSLLTVCGGASNNGSIATGAGSPAAKRERKPTPTPASAQQDLAQQLAELVGSGEIFKLTLEDAPQKLSKFAKLEDGMTPQEKRDDPFGQRLVGANPALGIQWIELNFRQNDASIKSWDFWSAYFALSRKEGDSDQLFNEFKATFASRLAKFRKLETYLLNNSVGWNLGGVKKVYLEKEVFPNPITKKSQRVTMVGIDIKE